jgi:FkbM family methyltransferase
VGANVGEMVMDMARNAKVESVHAFEPVADCVHAMRMSAALNSFDNVHIHHTAVSGIPGKSFFRYDVSNPSWSGIKGSGALTIEVPVTTLDAALGPDLRNPVLLLDVEGEEKNVMIGAKEIIERWSPPIVFEYNHVSRSQFDLEQVRSILGAGYELYRLRQSDGLLDTDFSDTWNCVAVHRDTVHYPVCRSLCLAKDGKAR